MDDKPVIITFDEITVTCPNCRREIRIPFVNGEYDTIIAIGRLIGELHRRREAIDKQIDFLTNDLKKR